MKLVKASYEVISYDNKETLKHIKRAGRTCYKSEDKITEKPHKIVKWIKVGDLK